VRLQCGDKLGPYEIVLPLGAGGMGEVYRARDSRLNRIVALKVLPIHLSGKPEAQARFDREARAIASLNHPNICQLYDVGQQEGISYLVMEHLEGETLALRLLRGALPLDQTLRYGMEVADALDAAHHHAIVHRDLKPGNIFITNHGESKVLDFGLAKLEEDADSADANTLTSPAVLTSPGVAVGTVAYMSPEQARGEPLDARTDIFSLGAVLYECATGRSAFPGKTSAVVFKSILDQTPETPSQINPAIPPKLEDILLKSLEKDREIRYQIAAELRGDLKRLQRDLTSRGVAATPLHRAEQAPPSQQPSANATSAASAVPPQSSPPSQGSDPSSGEKFVQPSPRRSRSYILAGLAAVAVLVAVGFGVRFWLSQSRPPLPLTNYTITQVPETLNCRVVSISPDAKYLAMVHTDDKGEQSLWLRHLSTNSNTQVIAPMKSADYRKVLFSPEGDFIYFIRGGETGILNLYRVPVLGGQTNLVAEDVSWIFSFSPDGRRLTFFRDNNPEVARYRLILADRDGGKEETLLVGKHPTPSNPMWSPDGRSIAFFRPAADHKATEAVLLDITTKKERTLARIPVFAEFLDNLTWMHDGRGLLFLDNDIASTTIDFISYPRGEVRTLASESGSYWDFSLSSDDQTLAVTVGNDLYGVYLLPVPKPNTVATEAQLQDLHMPMQIGMDASWTADGQLVVNTSAGIYLVDRQGGGKTPVFSDPKHPAFIPTLCPDQGTFLFAGFVAGTPSINIWKIDHNGQDLTQITYGNEDIFPVCSRDSEWVYYYDGIEQAIMKAPLSGSSPTKIAPAFFAQPSLSPDGKLLAYEPPALPQNGDLKRSIAFYATDGSTPPKPLIVDPGFAQEVRPFAGFIRFTPDGKSLAYGIYENTVSNILLQPLDGSRPRPLTHFTSETIRDFNFSPDGKSLVLVRGHSNSNIVLMRSESRE